MKRRGFFGAMLAAIAAPFVGKASALGRRGFVPWSVESRAVILNEGWMARVEPSYVAFMHPSTFVDIIEYYGRPDQRWRLAWGRYRTARKAGECGDLHPREIMERFLTEREPHDVPTEIGTWESVRFIESERMPV